MLRASLKEKCLLGIVLVVGLGMLASLGCQPAKKQFLENMVKKSRAKRQKMMKHLGIAKYLEGVDDNSGIVFVAMVKGKAQIHTILPAGEDMRQLTFTGGYKCRPVWNLPHTRIAFFQYPGDQPLGDTVSVMVMDADGENLRAAIAGKKINAKRVRISWKPDSSIIYFPEKDFSTIVYGYKTDSGEQVETVRLPANSFMTEVHSLSPDMQFLAGSGPFKQTHITHIGTIRRDGKLETDLMKPFKQIPLHVGTVIWNYDGALVAFELDKIIMVMSKRIALDFEVYPLTPQDFDAALSGPAFSPTSKYMACILEKASEGQIGSGDQVVSSDVWVMNIDGSKQRQITHTGSCFDPHW